MPNHQCTISPAVLGIVAVDVKLFARQIVKMVEPAHHQTCVHVKLDGVDSHAL
jgi:hypothetical protein